MAGALSHSKLRQETKAHFGFSLAARADDADIRQLLRENPTR